jgi:hypothetical protein
MTIGLRQLFEDDRALYCRHASADLMGTVIAEIDLSRRSIAFI